MKFFIKANAVVLILTLILAGCGGKEAGSGAAPGGGNSANGEPAGEKILTIAQGNDIMGFDIHNHSNTPTEAVHINLFEYLVKKDKDMNRVPGLALSWEKLDDLTWRFQLRNDVKFHNGDPFTSADVKYTLDRVRADKTLVDNSAYKLIESVNIIDDHTVDIVTSVPDPILLNRLSRLGSGVLPSKYIEENGFDYFLKNPIGTGPYKFSNWIRDDRIELVKNSDYYGDEPKWDKLVFRAIPEDSTRVAEVLTGNVDIAMNIPPEDMERIESNDTTHTIQFASQRVMNLIVRHTEGRVTADPKVREAIDLAIDKQALVDGIVEGAGVVTRTGVGPGNFGAQPDLYEAALYDPEKAKQLLAEAGYPDGLTLTLSSPTGRYMKDKDIAQAIAANLEEVGIKVNLEILEWSKFSEKNKSNSFDELYLFGNGNSMFDAYLPLSNNSAQNVVGSIDYNNPRVEELLSLAEKNLNEPEREQQLQEVQNILAEDRPRIYLFQTKSNYAVNDRIEYQPRLDEMFIADEILLK